MDFPWALAVLFGLARWSGPASRAWARLLVRVLGLDGHLRTRGLDGRARAVRHSRALHARAPDRQAARRKQRGPALRTRGSGRRIVGSNTRGSTDSDAHTKAGRPGAPATERPLQSTTRSRWAMQGAGSRPRAARTDMERVSRSRRSREAGYQMIFLGSGSRPPAAGVSQCSGGGPGRGGPRATGCSRSLRGAPAQPGRPAAKGAVRAGLRARSGCRSGPKSRNIHVHPARRCRSADPRTACGRLRAGRNTVTLD